MSSDHTLTLTRARSALAALADLARTFEASVAYEHVLLHLDRLYDRRPALDTRSLGIDRDALYDAALTALDALSQDDTSDPLRLALLIEELQAARAQDDR